MDTRRADLVGLTVFWKDDLWMAPLELQFSPHHGVGGFRRRVVVQLPAHRNDEVPLSLTILASKKKSVDLFGVKRPYAPSRLRDAFAQFDEDGSGEIDGAELGRAMVALGLNPSEAEIRHVFAEVDTDGSGAIEYDEFCKLVSALQEHPAA